MERSSSMGLLQVVELPQGTPECSREREVSMSLGSWCAAGYSTPSALCANPLRLCCALLSPSPQSGEMKLDVAVRG